ncbi:MAG: fumarylacetoacetate hydrolase family protein, partial [Phreatobacter sp.]
ISLGVNGARRQTGDIGQMIWNVAEIVANLSRHYALAPGDLIFTGTPAGVGPVVPGDRLEAAVAGLGRLSITITARED